MSDCLYPETSPFEIPSLVARYYRRVASALLPEGSLHTLAVVVCLPSFDAEWSIRLHGTRRSEYAITVSQFDSPVWGISDESAIPKVVRQSIVVTNEFADGMIESLVKLLRTVTNNNRCPLGLDGVSYHFVAHHSDYGTLCGRTWSPSPSTAAGRLVDALHELHEFMLAGGTGSSTLQTILDDFRRCESVPSPSYDSEALSKSITESERLVRFHQDGVISLKELAEQLASSWEHAGYHRLEKVMELVNCIPAAVREQLIKQFGP